MLRTTLRSLTDEALHFPSVRFVAKLEKRPERPRNIYIAQRQRLLEGVRPPSDPSTPLKPQRQEPNGITPLENLVRLKEFCDERGFPVTDEAMFSLFHHYVAQNEHHRAFWLLNRICVERRFPVSLVFLRDAQELFVHLGSKLPLRAASCGACWESLFVPGRERSREAEELTSARLRRQIASLLNFFKTPGSLFLRPSPGSSAEGSSDEPSDNPRGDDDDVAVELFKCRDAQERAWNDFEEDYVAQDRSKALKVYLEVLLSLSGCARSGYLRSLPQALTVLFVNTFLETPACQSPTTASLREPWAAVAPDVCDFALKYLEDVLSTRLNERTMPVKEPPPAWYGDGANQSIKEADAAIAAFLESRLRVGDKRFLSVLAMAYSVAGDAAKLRELREQFVNQFPDDRSVMSAVEFEILSTFIALRTSTSALPIGDSDVAKFRDIAVRSIGTAGIDEVTVGALAFAAELQGAVSDPLAALEFFKTTLEAIPQDSKLKVAPSTIINLCRLMTRVTGLHTIRSTKPSVPDPSRAACSWVLDSLLCPAIFGGTTQGLAERSVVVEGDCLSCVLILQALLDRWDDVAQFCDADGLWTEFSVHPLVLADVMRRARRAGRGDVASKLRDRRAMLFEA